MKTSKRILAIIVFTLTLLFLLQPIAANAQANQTEAYFWYQANKYRFVSDNSCGVDPYCFPNQNNPLANAIDYAKHNIYLVGDQIDDDTVRATAGDYGFIGFHAYPAEELIIEGEDPQTTTLDGLHWSGSNIDLTVRKFGSPGHISASQNVGNMAFENIHSGVSVEDHQGDVYANDIQSGFYVRFTTGNITGENIQTDSHLHDINGNITIVDLPAGIGIDNVNGTINLTNIENRLDLFNNTGEIFLNDANISDHQHHAVNIGNHDGAITIDGCDLHNNGSSGISIDNQNSPSTDPITILNCSSYDNGFDNIGVKSNSVVTLNNITVTGAWDEGYGLFIDNNNSIYANNITASYNEGVGAFLQILSHDPAHEIVVTGGTFEHNGIQGLDVTGPGLMAAYDVDTNYNGEWGLFIGSTNANVEVDDVNADGNFSGILAGSPNLIELDGVLVENSHDLGIFIANDGGALVASNLTSSNNGRDGIRIGERQGGYYPADIAITDSTFNSNYSDNVNIFTDGNLNLNNVTANGSISEYGFFVKSSGAIAATEISASNNAGVGAYLEIIGTDTASLSVNGGVFHNNGIQGLDATATGIGSVSVTNVTANGNGAYGLFMGSVAADASLSNSSFNGNQDGALLAAATDIFVENVVSEDNIGAGAIIKAANSGTPANALVSQSTFSNNGTWGIDADLETGTLTLNCVNFFANGDGAFQVAVGDQLIFTYSGCDPDLCSANGLEALRAMVLSLQLHKGTENSLLAKIDSAEKALTDSNSSNDHVALNSLNAFINQVSAQAGKKIAASDADNLINSAQSLIDCLSSSQ